MCQFQRQLEMNSKRRNDEIVTCDYSIEEFAKADVFFGLSEPVEHDEEILFG